MSYALFLKHRTKPGQRDAVEAVWRRHMAPAVSANPGHILYVYSFGDDPDVICAFQVYASQEESAAFLQSPAYQTYLDESRHLLEHDPEVIVLHPRWTKP